MKKIFNYVVVGTGISSLGILSKLSKNKKKKVLVIESPNKIFKKNFKNPMFCEEKMPVPVNSKKLLVKPFLKLLNYKNFGGNSNYWGGYSIRFNKRDILDWPIKIHHLKKYYCQAEKILGIKISNSEFEILKIKKKNNYSIKRSNISMHADRVFNSGLEIKKILKKNRYKIYFNELTSFKKDNNILKLFFKDSNKIILCKKLIICAGPYSTATILENSITNINIRELKQAQSFLIPVILSKLPNENLDLQINLKLVKRFGEAYLELKKNHNLLKHTLKKNYNFFYYILPTFLIKKVCVIWGFIPSKFSYNFTFDNKKKITIYKEKKNKKKITYQYLNSVIEKLKKKFNFIVLTKLIKLNQFARSYHVGCNIPMSKYKKNYLTTDLNGQLRGGVDNSFRQIYIVGPSLFESLPSKSYGLTLLANSLRIGDKL